MNTVENSSKDRVRQETAAEVIELGEMLFDTMIEAAQQPAQDKENDAPLIEEMRATADEFFTALRLLLGFYQKSGARMFIAREQDRI